MNILTFTYTKADGKVSDRVLAVSVKPTKLYAGTDISSLSPEEQVEYADQVNSVKEYYLSRLKQINEDYDLNFNFRQFSPEKMTNIVEEDI